MDVKDAKRIVVKVGTSTLTHQSGNINIRRLEELVKVLADIQNSGRQIVLVSSGAIAVGVGKLGLKERPSDIPTKQAAAAVGQCELMYIYDKLFSEYNHTVAQILMTADVLDDELRRENAHNTFEKLLEIGSIPIVNENDTVSVDEIKFGDNDNLSAKVAELISADLLIILSDIDGLFTANPCTDPDACLIHEVNGVDEKVMAMAGGAGTNRGTGGMITKLQAARIANDAGADMIIANGKRPTILYEMLFDGKNVGTLFKSQKEC